jgi:HSP20 family molecular chaperone IbpA
MSSFLQRLKKKDIVPSAPEDKKQEKVQSEIKQAHENTEPAEQLKVDIHRATGAIIVYAQIAGSSVKDYAVSIEGDGDIVTIKGQRNKPGDDVFQSPSAQGREKIIEECSWGKFYRQIILPAEVDASKAEAKMREGVLMLLLPLKRSEESGIRIQVTEV